MINHFILSETCTGLNPGWVGVVTETKFPVNAGTEVEVKCSDSGDTFYGSNKVTCVSGTTFTSTVTPNCAKPGTR